jgi:hypothetical protein
MRRVAGGGVGLWVALWLGAGCGGEQSSESVAPPAPPAVTAPLVAGHAGVRVDLAGTAHHVRALQRQPDGTYKSICLDDPAALRPAAPRPDRQPGGAR